MTATNHAITGAAIALIVKKPALAIPLAFLSHFLIDALPHFKVRGEILERNRNKLFWLINFLDLGFALVLFVILPVVLKPFVPVWLTYTCMFAGISPDLIWFYRVYGEVKTKIVKRKGRFSQLHSFIQWSEAPSGIVIEIFWFIGMWSVLIARA